MKAVFFFTLVASCVCAGQTTALYNPALPTVGPFPSNSLTVSDSTQQTGIRINLPSSFETCDPLSSPSVCSNTALLNALDGFSLNPRLMACFSGPINPGTLQSGMQIVPVGGGSAIPVNQIIFDPASNCAFAKPNQVLNQQSQYLLVVTNVIRDSGGKKVAQSDDFEGCLSSSDPYCAALAGALRQVRQIPANKVVTASLFTTMSATNWLEQARRYVDANQPAAVLPVGINNAPSVYNMSGIQTLTWVPQGSGDDTDNSETISPSTLAGVGQIAFGEFMSPLFLDPTSGSIPATPTGQPIAAPAVYVPVSFHVFLPANHLAGSTYPVVIYGHGLGDNQFGAPTYIASTLAQFGIATLAFEITGHGYGSGGVVNITTSNGVQSVSTPGRGIQLPGNSNIGPSDGCILPGALAVRDCGRQSAVDLFALVQTIRETNGLGFGLDPKRIYYIGQSFGGTYGTLFHATEPNESSAVLNGAGGTSVDVARLALTGRPLAIEYLASVDPMYPGLLNVDAGIAPPEPYFHDDFNDNYVFRDMPPVTNSVPGAMAIQAAFEAAEWIGMPGDPLSFAPHLSTSPLAGVRGKSTLFQFGYGDLEVPNPTESAVVRAANSQSSAWFLRFDEAAEIAPDLPGITMPSVAPLPILPHRILSNPTIFEYPDETPLSLAGQNQSAVFFFSGGALALNPNLFLSGEYAGSNLFQIPSTLPTQLNYFQIPQ